MYSAKTIAKLLLLAMTVFTNTTYTIAIPWEKTKLKDFILSFFTCHKKGMFKINRKEKL